MQIFPNNHILYVKMNISLRNKVETYQMFHPCSMDFLYGRVDGRMT